MDFKTLQAADYILATYCFTYAQRKNLETYPSTKLVIESEGKTFTANTYKTLSVYANEPFKPYTNEFGFYQEKMVSFGEGNPDNLSIVAARHAFFKFLKSEKTRFQEYEHPELLLELIVSLTNGLDLHDLDSLGSMLYNVQHLDSSIALPFIKVKEEQNFEIISLISKN